MELMPVRAQSACNLCRVGGRGESSYSERERERERERDGNLYCSVAELGRYIYIYIYIYIHIPEVRLLPAMLYGCHYRRFTSNAVGGGSLSPISSNVVGDHYRRFFSNAVGDHYRQFFRRCFGKVFGSMLAPFLMFLPPNPAPGCE